METENTGREITSMILFSVIIPVYNTEKYLERCMDSVRSQTYGNHEIILVDDGSTDNSPKICDDYREIDSRIRVIHKSNGGLSDARNTALETAKGDWVLFLDSDDYIERDALERFLPYTDTTADILMGDAFVENGDVDLSHIAETHPMTGREYLEKSVRAHKFPVVVWLNAYRLSFLKEHNLTFMKGVVYEDEEFTPRCFLECDSVLYTGIRFYHYSIRPGSITTRYDMRQNAEDMYTVCLSLEKLYRTLQNPLKSLLLDQTVRSYLGFYARARAFRYGTACARKAYCLRNAGHPKTRLRALLFSVSPRLYCCVVAVAKKILRSPYSRGKRFSH